MSAALKLENVTMTQKCKCCGRELPLSEYRSSRIGVFKTCNDCIRNKIVKGHMKRKQDQDQDDKVKEARSTRLRDFTGRELLLELKRRGYKFTGTYTEVRTFDSEKL